MEMGCSLETKCSFWVSKKDTFPGDLIMFDAVTLHNA